MIDAVYIIVLDQNNQSTFQHSYHEEWNRIGIKETIDEVALVLVPS